jgi:hypothetical protein
VLTAEQVAASPGGAVPYTDLEGWQRVRLSERPYWHEANISKKKF